MVCKNKINPMKVLILSTDYSRLGIALVYFYTVSLIIISSINRHLKKHLN